MKSFNDIKCMVEKGASKKSLLEEMEKYQDEHIDAGWTIDDVLGTAKEMGRKMSRKTAIEVARFIEKKHDAEYGITWQYIRDSIDNFNAPEDEDD